MSDLSQPTLSRRQALASAAALGVLGALDPRGAYAQTGGEAAAVVEGIQFPAWIERGGVRQALTPGESVRRGEMILTGNPSRVLLRLPDRSVVKLGDDSQFRFDELVAQRGARDGDAPGAVDVRASFRLVTGTIRYASDTLSKAFGSKRQISLTIATATIGVRGTDFWSMTDADHDAVCVFDGAVDIQRPSQEPIVLDKPSAFWVVFTGRPPTPPGVATPDQLKKFISQVEATPGAGIGLPGGAWRVTLGVFPTRSAAQAQAAEVRGRGYPAVVRDISSSGVTVHEVHVPELATRADAQSVAGKLVNVPGAQPRPAFMPPSLLGRRPGG
jgi:hypothetical protein